MASSCSGKLNSSIVIRLVAITWNISAFILVVTYSTYLISYVTSPNPKPMIDSINNIEKYPEIILTTDVAYDSVVDNSVKTSLV